MRGLRAALVALLVLAASGCGARVEFLGGRWGAECPVVADPLSALVVPEDQANVHLFVSNQSFEDPAVRMAVRIDGELVLDQDFDVCGQHDWVAFPLALAPGWHDLEVTTDSGVRQMSRVDVPDAPGGRWVVVSYWTEPDAYVDVDVRGEPVAFA